MALQKGLSLENGMFVNDAYIRIDTIAGYKGGLDISVNAYISKETFSDGTAYIDQKFYHFVPSVTDDSPNFIKQGYTYLKSLSEYSSAIDIME